VQELLCEPQDAGYEKGDFDAKYMAVNTRKLLNSGFFAVIAEPLRAS
jgi:hypothetical protein